jgi:serine phosphatase RsbU (regulator of sigma subunit)
MVSPVHATQDHSPGSLVGSHVAPAAGPIRRRLLRSSTVFIGALGLMLTVALAAGAQVASNDSETRLLNSQLQEVATALEASIPQLQQPLIAADQIASSTRSAHAFDAFVQTEVGDGAPFRAVSLWRIGAAQPRLLASVGRSTFLSQPRVASQFLAGLRPSTELSVTGIFSGPPRGYGIAEVLPGSTDGLVVFAEPRLLPASSPVAGLVVALYLGRTVARQDLMASSAPTYPAGPRATAVVPFASSTITIVATSTRPLAGILSGDLPWLIGGVGVLLVLLAAVANERHIRRRELAESLATATELRYDVQRDISNTLQQALLPEEHPAFPGVDLATRYVAGTRGLEIGGDFYETIGIDDDRLFIAVGDVSGRGLLAATAMTYLRHAIRAYVAQGDGPDEVLGKLDELIDIEHDEYFATVLCVLVEVAGRRVTMATAGHPPPLLIDDDGARFVELAVNPPIGTAGGARPAPRTIVVAERAAIVAFTDGLVERRDVALDDRLESLRAAADGLHGPMDATLTQLLASLIPDGADDDIAILGVKWRG